MADISGYEVEIDGAEHSWTFTAHDPKGQRVYGSVLTAYQSRADAEIAALDAIQHHAKEREQHTYSGNELHARVNAFRASLQPLGGETSNG